MPTTTTRPRALLRAAIAALGVWLVVLAALNLYIVGRGATDENLFVDPLSRFYIVREVPGTPGTPRYVDHPLAGVAHDAIAGDRLLVGDVLMEMDGERIPPAGSENGRPGLRARVAQPGSVEVVAFRARTGQALSVVVRTDDLRGAFRSIQNTVLVVQVVPGGASDRAGMLPGDVITRINGQGFASSLDADRIMRTSQIGRETAYDILRAGEPLTLEVRLAKFGINIGPLLLFVVGVLYIVAGTTVASLRTHIKAARYLGLGWMGAGLTIALLLNRPRRMLPGWDLYVSDAFLVLSATIGIAHWLHAMHYFPRERPGLVQRRWAKRGGYGLALVLSALVLVVLWWLRPNADGLFFPAAILMMWYAAVATVRTRHTYTPEDRQISRPTSIALGVAVGFTLVSALLGVSVAQVRGRDLPVNVAPVVQITGALLWLGVLAVHLLVIGRYRLLELDLRVRRNVQYLVISAAWTALIIGLGVWLWWWLMHLELALPNVRFTGDAVQIMPTPMDAASNAVFEKGVLIALSVVLAFVFRAMLKRGHRALAEQYYQEGYDYRRASREFSEVMGPRMDLDGLADGLLTVIDRLMPVKRAGVVFVQGTRLVSSKRSIGFETDNWDIFCSACVEEAVDVVRASKATAELDTEYAPPRLRLALRRAQIHHLYPIGGHDELRGVLFIGEKLSEAAYTADDFAFLGVIAGQAALLVENAFLYENLAAQERVRQELAIARRIQLESLPQRPPTVAGLDVAGTSVPAQEVGGDYFDYLDGAEGHLAVMIGDVSGKGTSAALYMSKLQGVVRSLHGFGLAPRQLFVRTNDLLGRDMERRAFVTALGAFFDTTTRTVVVARAGHLPLYHYRAATGDVVRCLPKGLGLGLTHGDLFAHELVEQVIAYGRGDVFLFVTDGITEGHGADREEFGEDRLVSLFTRLAAARTPVADIVSAVTTAVAEFTDGAPQHDDQTVVAVRAL